MLTDKKEWLADRRDLYVRNIVKDFFSSSDFFHEIEKKIQEKGLSYDGMETWVGTQENRGTLWQLKDLCHDLWKNVEPDKNPHKFMFDWIIGTLFHEAMKLKENLYVLMNYRPAYNTLYFPENDADNPDDQCPSFFNEIAEEINRGLKRIRCLYGKALNTLQAIVGKEKDNALLIRFILDERKIDPEKWNGEKGLGVFLQTLFPNGFDEALCIAGESYLEGSWYTEAKDAFEEALSINPDCSEAKSALRILEKRLKEIALLLEREYTVQQKIMMS